MLSSTRQAEEEPRLLVRAREAELRARARRRASSRRGRSSSTVPDVTRQVACDHVEERRLAGAVRAEDRAALAGDDLEVDVAYRMQAAEAPADPRKRRVGSACFGWLVLRSTRLLDDLRS